MTGDGAGLLRVVGRGLRRRCPACGRGRVFDGFLGTRERCAECGFDFRDPAGDTWAILYLSTGAITGIGIVALLAFTPKDPVLGRLVVALIVALVFGATIPMRRSFAIAVHFWMRRAFGEL